MMSRTGQLWARVKMKKSFSSWRAAGGFVLFSATKRGLILSGWWWCGVTGAAVIGLGAASVRGEEVRAAVASAGPGTTIRLAGGVYAGTDMVGCHRGVIEGSTFRGTAGLQSNGVQAKGGSSGVAIRRNRFDQTGGRGVNLGGSTGRPYFRPPLALGGGNAEARDLRVEGNTFVGTMAPVVFAGVDGAVVRFNTIDNPNRWAVRILQESGGPEFVPCRQGVFTDNVILFRSDRWSGGGVNIGGSTAPGTFTFSRNWWHGTDRPDRSRPRLPVEESDGRYGQGPDAGKDAAGAGAWKDDTSRPSDSPPERRDDQD